jgi:RecB family exonuclease
MAATALEALGRCPLQFFFRHVLHVEAPRTPPTPFESDPASIGSRIHEVLREVYSQLREGGAFEGNGVDARVIRAREILRKAWTVSAGADDVERAARLPLLDEIERQTWLAALDAFLDADLRRMAKDGLVPDALELDVKGPIPDGPTGLVIRARFDRVMRGREGAVVSDYKTGRELKDRVSPSAMLSGAALQVPIYALLSALPVELLAVGPNPDADVLRFENFKSDDQRSGFLETLRIVAALSESGRFPIRPGSHCDRCDYRSACRRGHPPTEYREDHAEDIRDARDCWSKTGKLPTLAAVRDETAP